MEILETFRSIIDGVFSRSTITNKHQLINLFSTVLNQDNIIYSDLKMLETSTYDDVHCLDLNGKKISALPTIIFSLPQLKVLDLSNNPGIDLSGIGKLNNLQVLILTGCHLHKIPDEIKQLEKLNIFISGGNNLESYSFLAAFKNLNLLSIVSEPLDSLPKPFYTLKNIYLIYLRKNGLKKIDSEIGNLTSLAELYILNNQLREIPLALARLSNLTTLNLDENLLVEIPPFINQLEKLQLLNLNNNHIMSIPMEIGANENLLEVYLRSNRISSLPKSLEQLKKLKTIDISENNLYNIPLDLDQLDSLIHLDIRGNFLSEKEKAKWYEYLYKLSKKKFRYIKLNLPDGLKVVIKQYLMFFKEYVRIAKQKIIHFELRDCQDGVEVETRRTIDEEQTIQINEYFKEYFGFLQKNFETIPVEGNPSELEIDLLRLKLEQQINNLEQQLKLLKVENTYLKNIVDNLLKIQLINASGKHKLIDLSTDEEHTELKEKVKGIIIKGDIVKGIELLLKSINRSSKKYQELLLLFARINQLEMETRIGILSKDEKSKSLNQIIKSLIETIDDLDGIDFKKD